MPGILQGLHLVSDSSTEQADKVQTMQLELQAAVEVQKTLPICHGPPVTVQSVKSNVGYKLSPTQSVVGNNDVLQSRPEVLHPQSFKDSIQFQERLFHTHVNYNTGFLEKKYRCHFISKRFQTPARRHTDLKLEDSGFSSHIEASPDKDPLLHWAFLVYTGAPRSSHSGISVSPGCPTLSLPPRHWSPRQNSAGKDQRFRLVCATCWRDSGTELDLPGRWLCPLWTRCRVCPYVVKPASAPFLWCSYNTAP